MPTHSSSRGSGWLLAVLVGNAGPTPPLKDLVTAFARYPVIVTRAGGSSESFSTALKKNHVIQFVAFANLYFIYKEMNMCTSEHRLCYPITINLSLKLHLLVYILYY